MWKPHVSEQLRPAGRLQRGGHTPSARGEDFTNYAKDRCFQLGHKWMIAAFILDLKPADDTCPQTCSFSVFLEDGSPLCSPTDSVSCSGHPSVLQ